MAVQPAATLDQLKELFIHVTRVGAATTNITTFLNNPRSYVNSYVPAAHGGGNQTPALQKMVLSDRQRDHLTAGATIANELALLMRVGTPPGTWLAGAVASTAACRPAYGGPVFAAAYSGVGANIIPSDPIAVMLWNWNTPGAQKTQIKALLDLMRGAKGVPPGLKDTLDELRTYVIV